MNPHYSPNPDFTNLLKVLEGKRPARPTLFEFYMNPGLYRQFAGELPVGCPDHLRDMLTLILAFRNLGYDYASVKVDGFRFSTGTRDVKESISMSHGGVIHDQASCDAYFWPDPDAAAYHVLDEIAPFVPEGMKLIVWGEGGVLENVTSLIGYEDLCIMLMEEEDLAADIFERVGSRFARYYRNCLQHDVVGGIISNDDWGFRSQTLLSPEHLRRFVFPWHRQIAEAAHAAGRPAILHSCGQLNEVWEDIICSMKFDGKHSYEDAIFPVEESYEKYQGRIGILGGMDLDFVCRSTPEEVYRRAVAMVERTQERGGYGLGTGNSIPEYTPMENYLAMIRAVQERH